MLYFLQQSKTEQKIIEQCVRLRQPLPDAIANAPVLYWGLELYYCAFFDLSSERLYAEGPIPWIAIRRYANELELNDEQTETLHHHVSRLDAVYADYQSKKSKERHAASSVPTKQPDKPGKPGFRRT